jgi:hypothetical protein
VLAKKFGKTVVLVTSALRLTFYPAWALHITKQL